MAKMYRITMLTKNGDVMINRPSENEKDVMDFLSSYVRNAEKGEKIEVERK